jgi:hypothetical protein
VKREFVFLCPDRNRLYPELVGGAKDANGNFRTVGYQNFGNGQDDLLSAPDAGMLHPRRNS